MTTPELEAVVTGRAVTELQDWSSLWGDLLHVDMVLLARAALPKDAANLFARRGLWEAAVIAYGRTAMSGRRQQQIGELLTILGRDAAACHAEVMGWRNQHAAHRVDPSREKVDVRVLLDPAQRRVKCVQIRVAPVLGPEEEDDTLVARFTQHVKALRDLTGQQRIHPLELRLIDECAGDVEALLRVARPPAGPAAKGFAIDINPSGR